MGQIMKSFHLDCCFDDDEDNKPIGKIKAVTTVNSDSEGDGNELAQIEFSRYCFTENPKTSIEFPVKLKNLFFEHFSNPWSTYKELKL